MDNHSCAECHEKIYDEFQSSMHSKGYFNDELHRKVADTVSKQKYECALCHMPMADNIKDLIDGKARPDKSNKTHTDAISCYFCHTIAYVKKSHKFNINVVSKQAANYKPTLYGRLVNPDDNDKHSSVKNPIYAKKVCMGCHAFKLNDNNVTIFRAMDSKQDSQDCIKCHMPELSGGSDKMNKRARDHHASHHFLGIHDKEFRKKGVDINISTSDNQIKILLTNKMGHPLVIQSARSKYMKISLLHDGKIIWTNYTHKPDEDKQGYFANSFKKNGHKIIIPATSTSGTTHNLAAKKSLLLTYDVPRLAKGDIIKAALYVRLAKKDCDKVIKLQDSSLTDDLLIKQVEYMVRGALK